MGTVTYKNQPAIHKTRGNIPLAEEADDGTDDNWLMEITSKYDHDE